MFTTFSCAFLTWSFVKISVKAVASLVVPMYFDAPESSKPMKSSTGTPVLRNGYIIFFGNHCGTFLAV